MLQGFDDALRLFHAALAFQGGSEETCSWLDDMIAKAEEPLKVLLCGGMGVHVEVHCRSHEDRGFHAEVGGDKHVVGYAVCHLSDGACGSGSYEHGICPKAEADMRMPTTVPAVEELAHNGLLRQGGKRQGRYELFGCWSHHDLNFGSFLDEKTGKEACFIGCYASRYAKDYLFIFQHTSMQVVQVFVSCCV